jgi:hypothetical protein
MMVERVAGFYASPRVGILDYTGVRCIKTPVGPDGVDVHIGQIDRMLVWSAVESLFFPSMLCSPKRVCSSGILYV